MKRAGLVILCVISLCIVGLVIKPKAVRAYKEGYEVIDYMAITTPTIDGSWTATDEWNDTDVRQLDGSLNVTFRLKYVAAPDFSYVHQYYLIEFFDDTTNDTGDYWQICYAAAIGDFGTPVGGTAPQTDCFRWDFVGHHVAGFDVYRGSGSTWVEFTEYTWETDVHIVDSFGTSPLSDTPHWMAEIKIDHIQFDVYPEFWIYLAAYDESNSGAGIQSWPPGSSDIPDDWGFLNPVQETIPEAWNIGVTILLSSASLLIAFHHMRKRSRVESCCSREPGESKIQTMMSKEPAL